MRERTPQIMILREREGGRLRGGDAKRITLHKHNIEEMRLLRVVGYKEEHQHRLNNALTEVFCHVDELPTARPKHAIRRAVLLAALPRIACSMASNALSHIPTTSIDATHATSTTTEPTAIAESTAASFKVATTSKAAGHHLRWHVHRLHTHRIRW